VRVCPKCHYRDEPYWRPAKMHNPSGDVDIARIDDLIIWQPEIAKQLTAARGIVAEDKTFAYLLTKRSVWVRRINKELYEAGGISAFNQPAQHSGHNPLALRNTGSNKRTFRKKTDQRRLLEVAEK